MSITITDTTVNPLLITDGQSLAAFKGVTVADSSALNDTEKVSITLSQSSNPPLGPNYDFYPTVTNLGSISDPDDPNPTSPNGWNAGTETFTESGLVGGDPDFATDLLSRLQYNAPPLPNGQGFATQASITVTDGGVATTDTIPIKIGVVSPPAITGTVPDAPVAAGNSIAPFSIVNVTNPYFDYYYYTLVAGNPYTTEVATPGETDYAYNSSDTATIAVTDGGQATDADGLLTGPGLSKTGVGTYSLIAQQYYNIGYALQNLKFATNTLPAGAAENPIFQVDITDTTSGLTTSAIPNPSLLIIGQQKSPIIAGTEAGQTVAPGNSIDPFASVTITDLNQPSPMDSATITLTNAAGAATDANGTLTGNGLTETASGSGVYTLAATDPATLTAELDSLVFHPTGLPGGATSETTGFTLAVNDPAFSPTVYDNKTTVTETAPPGPVISETGSVLPAANFIVNDETTGQTTEQVGTPYPAETTLALSVTDTQDNLSDTYKATTVGQTKPFSNVAIVDTAPGASDIAFIDLGSSSAGSLSLPSDPSALTASLDGERYTLSATNPATLTTEIDGLVYTPASATFIDITPDNLNIASVMPNVYIHTGDGNDGINVSYAGGNNILDGEGGSNFLAGGSGNDTFFVNDLYATTPSWTTIEGFHAGDAATVWGITPTDFNLSWMGGQGAAGYTGLTLFATAAGNPKWQRPWLV